MADSLWVDLAKAGAAGVSMAAMVFSYRLLRFMQGQWQAKSFELILKDKSPPPFVARPIYALMGIGLANVLLIAALEFFARSPQPCPSCPPVPTRIDLSDLILEVREVETRIQAMAGDLGSARRWLNPDPGHPQNVGAAAGAVASAMTISGALDGKVTGLKRQIERRSTVVPTETPASK